MKAIRKGAVSINIDIKKNINKGKDFNTVINGGFNKITNGRPKPCNTESGSITSEAALIVPLFLCILFSLVFLIKVVYVHEVIQHAITGAANEMASTAYVYYVSGLKKLHDAARDGIESESQAFREHISAVFDSYSGIKSTVESVIKKTGESNPANDENTINEGNVVDNADNAVDAVNILKDALKEAASAIAEGEFDDLKTRLCIPVIKLYMEKYLNRGRAGDVDRRLRGLGVVGGESGLDFSNSSFFEDEDDKIEIVVKYRISLPVPFKILPEPVILQSASVKAWLDGDGRHEVADDDANVDGNDIWLLSNFERGRRLREIYGANLPFNFPVIAIFESGKATMIKSMDLTSASYQNADTVFERVCEYLDTLRDYEGQEEPWGSSNIVIAKEDIRIKELLLIIPGNPVKPEITAALEMCRAKAAAQGITMRIEIYGYKGQRDGEQNEADKGQNKADDG